MKIIDNILNLIFPPTCGFCGEVNTNFLCNKCKNKYELKENIKIASKYDNKILIEQGIIGRGVECAVLGND